MASQDGLSETTRWAIGIAIMVALSASGAWLTASQAMASTEARLRAIETVRLPAVERDVTDLEARERGYVTKDDLAKMEERLAKSVTLLSGRIDAFLATFRP